MNVATSEYAFQDIKRSLFFDFYCQSSVTTALVSTIRKFLTFPAEQSQLARQAVYGDGDGDGAVPNGSNALRILFNVSLFSFFFTQLRFSLLEENS